MQYLTRNRYENLEAYDTNSNTTTDITDADYNIETMNNNVAKNKFDQNHHNLVCRQKQLVVNQQPENQTVFNRLPVVLSKLSYRNTSDRNKFHVGSISIFSYSIPKEIR